MTWTDHGRPLPLDQVFAAHLGGVKQRLGFTVGRAQQRETRRNAESESIELRRYAAADLARVKSAHYREGGD